MSPAREDRPDAAVDQVALEQALLDAELAVGRARDLQARLAESRRETAGLRQELAARVGELEAEREQRRVLEATHAAALLDVARREHVVAEAEARLARARSPLLVRLAMRVTRRLAERR